MGGAHGPPDGNRFLASSELYDPNLNNGQWRYTAGHLGVAREGLFAIKLQNGKVLVGGAKALGIRRAIQQNSMTLLTRVGLQLVQCRGGCSEVLQSLFYLAEKF